MRNTSVTKAYQKYYQCVLSKDHTNPNLIAMWGSDPSRFETQILCKREGTPLPGNKFEQDGEVFGPQRWPYNSDSEPNYSDPPIQYIIGNRMKAIGTSWWDWKAKQTVGLGYDFDSLVGHADGLSESEIQRIDNIDVPWLEVIKSTRGGGRHIYIWFKDPFPIAKNHNEHRAIARSFIPLIAKHTGLDVEGNVDVCGQMMWIHHVDASDDGYTVVHPATQILTADFVPPNWRDHLEVVKGGRNKVRVRGWNGNQQTDGDELDSMTQAHAKVPLDEVHLKILDALEDTGHTSLWVHDHHLWQGHTAGLKQVFDDWAEKGHPMKGLFDTNSLDSDPGKPNCFARPRLNGGWDVFRFGKGVQESPLWDTIGGWTHTTLNYPPTLRQVCLYCGAFEGPSKKHGFIFTEVGELKETLQFLKSKVKLPPNIEGRTLSLYAVDDKIFLNISKERGDKQQDFPGFVKETKGWQCAIDDAIETSDKEQEEEILWSDLDDKVRALKIKGPASTKFDSWVLKDVTTSWVAHPRRNIESFLVSQGYPKPDSILGSAIYKAWELVNQPFQPEYPGGREWNREAAQFVYSVADLQEEEHVKHPTWDRVLNHCGTDLTPYVPALDWCKDWGILDGGDYLLAWLACMFRNPFGKLPYLFMYGPQNSGKSSFHEAISLLLTKGVVKADRALTSEQGYNGELMDAILAVIDEVDITKAGTSTYNKLKEWTTGLTISIHAKYRGVQDVRSTLHFVQMANSRASLPVFPGDTRITAMHVPTLEKEIPRDQLHKLLKEEAPHFMYTLMNYEIPPAIGRFMLPMIETEGKAQAVESNVDELEYFINENCYKIKGQAIKLNDFKQKFLKTLEEYQRPDWTSRLIRNRLVEMFPVGKGGRDNTYIIGNLTFDPNTKEKGEYIKEGSKLVREDW